jgi:thiosulfate reductase cytochrome b subunit
MENDMAKSTGQLPPKLHPPALRVMHWINAISVIALIFSGWKIYDDAVILGWLHFPDWITLGGHPETALQWHFLFMWPLILNGLFYLAYGIASGRFARKFFPISPREVIATIREALSFKLGHDDIRHYNGVQKLLYVGVITILIIQIWTGLVLWKPVQFSELLAPFGTFQNARTVHFIGMVLISGFICVHVLLAILVPKTIVAMVTGGPRDEVAGHVEAPTPAAVH